MTRTARYVSVLVLATVGGAALWAWSIGVKHDGSVVLAQQAT